MGKYQYDYPMAAVCADAVIFRYVGIYDEPYVLLIKRNTDPFRDCWALPGGFMEVESDDDLEHTARRELEEEVGLKFDQMFPVGVFSSKNRDPRRRTISAAYYAKVLDYGPDYDDTDDDPNREDNFVIDPNEVQEAKWFSVNELPLNLAFDHEEIIDKAVKIS